ncbi:VOC family protein [Rhodobacter ferrooxidans]|uniref:3-demethylubiquinone-9 3-methyltransferase n=1 Tax=Rhodobacter ferrooxidans TaxID=371731 RepID=C8S2W6_9RHOB|nr:VOC family protein [Rhodobacter sp. SW2]EEW24606.1 3-demethylubiquinone-9 3-methyltransferase [Rhodobacter sp. SW2]
MTFMPYLHFDGTCAQAMRFYADLFGGTNLQLMTYAEAPPGQMPPSDRIMHAQFTAAGGTLMASDYPPGMAAQPQTSVSVMTAPASVDEGQRLFAALAEGGSVVMPWGPTFWSPGFGMAQDRFGTHWIIGVEQPAA